MTNEATMDEMRLDGNAAVGSLAELFARDKSALLSKQLRCFILRHTILVSMEDLVDTVKISPKFQVVIPRDIRERLGLEPGQRIQALAYENRIELIPVRPLKRMRGFLRGIDTSIRRERDRV